MKSKSGKEINLNEIFQFVSHLVCSAGRLVTDAYLKEKTVTEKEVFSDFVTETDKLVENTLIQSIRIHYPNHRFVGEESTTSKIIFTDDPTWVIDPIDGTINFVHKFSHLAISVALFVDKEPCIGIVYNPVTEEFYSAIKGQGAYKNGQPIHSSLETELNTAHILTEFGYVNNYNNHIDIKMSNMRNLIGKCHNIRCMGSAALSCCLVAQGSFDLYYEFGIHVWDIAAGVLIAKEANCVLIDPVTGEENLNLLNRRLMISSSRELAKKSLQFIQPVIYETD